MSVSVRPALLAPQLSHNTTSRDRAKLVATPLNPMISCQPHPLHTRGQGRNAPALGFVFNFIIFSCPPSGALDQHNPPLSRPKKKNNINPY